MTIAQLLAASAVRLRDAGVEEPQKESSTLLIHALNRDGSFLIAHPEYELTDNEQNKFEAFVTRRANREPFHYITGHKEFFGLDFEVSPDVLIPRPETEILVEAAIDIVNGLDTPHFCEIGVGSGCISVSILTNVPNATALGIEISDKALAVAKRNSEKHGVIDRFILKNGDLFAGATEHFDLIVSNPPYIPTSDFTEMQPEVRDYEPYIALFTGNDGLDIVRRLLAEAPHHLDPGGKILIEIGFGQERLVREIFDESEWEEPTFLQDLQGIPRITVGKLKEFN